MNLFIFKYNNYYNRILKKEETLEAYGTPVYVYEPQSFNPNDGINTSVLVGDSFNPYDGTGDYLILEEDEEILSHWFIIETAFETARAQWKLTLRRDLLVDFYNDYINTDCFIEKATLNADDPLLFNEEDMSFNQIKTSETLLKDKSGCAWLVGYYDKSKADIAGSVDYNNNVDIPYITIPYNTIEDWPLYGHEENSPIEIFADTGNYNINALRGNLAAADQFSFSFDSSSNIFVKEIASGIPASKYSLKAQADTKSSLPNAISKIGILNLKSQMKAYIPEEDISLKDFLEFSTGTIVKTTDNKYYELAIITKPKIVKNIPIVSGSLYLSLSTIAQNAKMTGTPNSESFSINCDYNVYTINIRERKDLSIQYDLSGTKIITEDAPYNIFAIPFGDFKVLEPITTPVAGYQEIKINSDVSMAVASSIVKDFKDFIYDIQLLPYSPILDSIKTSGAGRFVLDDETKTNQYSKIIDPQTNETLSVIFNVPKAQFTLNIEYNIEIENSAIEKKISNQCDKYRLCSPNFNGYFDFSPAKNGGVQYFNVDCFYKPYQPYIHINPNFSGLYGQDFNDPRGLICGGDFSLSQISDAWKSYQVQNKNFQEMFDRQIQNMEIQNKYQKVSELLQAGIGTVQGAAAGTVIGGPGIGGVAGGLVGGVASLAGGIGDIAINEQLRTEAMDYTKDMFDYQLGNIQALPYTLTKVSSFNNNNKIFPLLERYTCTDREKDAFAKKLAYNGMTTMIIDKPSKYIGNSWSRELSDGELLESKGYIKGQIIRIETLEDEFHLLKSISDEFYKGVYIK